jgi:hypothetical protein
MINRSNRMSMLYGLKLIKGQWGELALAMVASFLILTLDYLLTTGMPKVISGLNLVLADGNLSNAPKETIVLAGLIILRPVIGWLINLFQINIILNILRKLEDKICFNAKQTFLNDPLYSSENYANMVISHGRYYVDAYLIPLIRALTDVGSILVISIGLSLQFPATLALFIGSIAVVLVLYHLMIGNILSASGKLLLDSYEKIITLSRNGFTQELAEQDHDIGTTLDDKKRASLSLGSLSQGLRYVIEFSFMFSFGIASIYVVMIHPERFAIFLSTFAYAGVRMLPSFTTALAFTQGKTSAEHPIRELSLILNTK